VGIWQLPGGNTGAALISNLLTLIFVGGLLFFAFRLYMENRSTIFGLEDRVRGVLYASLAIVTLALVGTRQLWDQGGVGVLVWFAMCGVAAWGLITVYRAWRAY
jgi:TRAP-type C4-dicarboxylate transport system permease small subunit